MSVWIFSWDFHRFWQFWNRVFSNNIQIIKGIAWIQVQTFTFLFKFLICFNCSVVVVVDSVGFICFWWWCRFHMSCYRLLLNFHNRIRVPTTLHVNTNAWTDSSASHLCNLYTDKRKRTMSVLSITTTSGLVLCLFFSEFVLKCQQIKKKKPNIFKIREVPSFLH